MSTLQTVFVVLAAGMILFWLMFAVLGPRKIDLPNVLAVMQYGPVLRTLALILALAPPTIMSYVIWVFMWRNNTTLATAGGSFLLTSFFAGWLYLETEAAQIVLTEDGITRFSPWVGRVTLAWSEVEAIAYSPVNRWFVVKGGGRTIRVSRHLSGLRIFAETVRRKIAAERYANAAAVMEVIKG